jgi:hypothetical protein
MTVMATTTRTRPSTSGARRVDTPATVAARETRRVKMAVACYLGIVVMIALALAASTVLPAGVGVPLFVLGMGLVVALAHPTIRVARRIR